MSGMSIMTGCKALGVGHTPHAPLRSQGVPTRRRSLEDQRGKTQRALFIVMRGQHAEIIEGPQ